MFLKMRGCMIFLVLLLKEPFFLRLGLDSSTLCFVKRFFCVSSLVFFRFAKEMLILPSSMQ